MKKLPTIDDAYNSGFVFAGKYESWKSLPKLREQILNEISAIKIFLQTDKFPNFDDESWKSLSNEVSTDKLAF